MITNEQAFEVIETAHAVFLPEAFAKDQKSIARVALGEAFSGNCRVEAAVVAASIEIVYPQVVTSLWSERAVEDPQPNHYGTFIPTEDGGIAYCSWFDLERRTDPEVMNGNNSQSQRLLSPQQWQSSTHETGIQSLGKQSNAAIEIQLGLSKIMLGNAVPSDIDFYDLRELLRERWPDSDMNTDLQPAF